MNQRPLEMWLVVLVLCRAAVARQFSRTPSNMTATVGDRVVLRCGVDQAAAGLLEGCWRFTLAWAARLQGTERSGWRRLGGGCREGWWSGGVDSLM